MILFKHYVLFYLKWMMMVEKMSFVTDDEKIYEKYNEI